MLARILLWSCGLFLFLPVSVLAQGVGDPPDMQGPLKLLSNPEGAKKVNQALTDLDDESWAKGFPALQAMLSEPDFFMSIPGASTPGPNFPGPPRFSGHISSAHWLLKRALKQLTPKGKAEYDKLFGPQAKKLLDLAEEKKDPALLKQISDSYLHTSVGEIATKRLAKHHWSEKQYDLAAYYMERLSHRTALAEWSAPDLMQAAVIFQHAGDAGHLSEVNEHLAVELKGEKKLRWEMREWTFKDIQKHLQSIKPIHPLTQEPYDWGHIGGNVYRDAVATETTGEIGKLLMRAPLSETKETRFLSREELARLRKAGYPVLPPSRPVIRTLEYENKLYPLLIGRTAFGLVAREVKTGEIRWVAPHFDRSLDRWSDEVVTRSSLERTRAYRPDILFASSLAGDISSDEMHAYAINDFQLVYPAMKDERLVTLGNLAKYVKFNTLQAYDEISGKLQWELGGSKNWDEEYRPRKPLPVFEDSHFLGTPLSHKGRLYVLNQQGTQLRLMILEAKTGEPISIHPFGKVPPLCESFVRRLHAVHLTLYDNLLICPTHAGAVIGFDLDEDAPKWVYRYRQTHPLLPTLESLPWWGCQPIPRGIQTMPDDRSHIHCIDLRDGTENWTILRHRDDLYVAGARDGVVLIVGEKGCRAIERLNPFGRMNEGVWSTKTGRVTGYGILTENTYDFPVLSSPDLPRPHIVSIDLKTGKILHRSAASEKPKEGTTEPPFGNLLFHKGLLISQGTDEVRVYERSEKK